jgi:hypothetical protein
MTLRALEEQSPQRLAHPDTSTVFVLGLLSIGFFPLGIAAWYFGNRLLLAHDADPGRWAHRSLVEAGRVMGMIGICLGVLGVVVLLLLLP